MKCGVSTGLVGLGLGNVLEHPFLFCKCAFPYSSDIQRRLFVSISIAEGNPQETDRRTSP